MNIRNKWARKQMAYSLMAIALLCSGMMGEAFAGKAWIKSAKTDAQFKRGMTAQLKASATKKLKKLAAKRNAARKAFLARIKQLQATLEKSKSFLNNAAKQKSLKGFAKQANTLRAKANKQWAAIASAAAATSGGGGVAARTIYGDIYKECIDGARESCQHFNSTPATVRACMRDKRIFCRTSARSTAKFIRKNRKFQP